MKKTLSIVLMIMMVAVMAVSVSAADSGSIPAVHSYYEELGNMSAQFKGGESTEYGCLGLGPVDYGDGEFGDAFMEFEFDVDTEGTYCITVRYAAKQSEGQIRCADMVVNGGERIHLPIENTGAWDSWAEAVVEVELKAGTNIIHLKNVENFDNDQYKAINVDYLAWAIKTDDVVEEPAGDVTEEPVDEVQNPTDDVTTEEPVDAPQTGFAVVALALTAVVSGAYISTKKR